MALHAPPPFRFTKTFTGLRNATLSDPLEDCKVRFVTFEFSAHCTDPIETERADGLIS
jgi:hypothetical protein